MQTMTNGADINAKSIPDREIEGLAKAILDLADSVMARPGMMERYEAWKKKRGANNAACTI